MRKYIRYKKVTNLRFCVTGDMRKIFHYEQNRALTVRELAKLQSYPDDFIFKGTKISTTTSWKFRSAKMAEVIASAIIKMSENV
ncbi:MAG: DNA cytosine methyltransferase [Cloacibacterium normanense]